MASVETDKDQTFHDYSHSQIFPYQPNDRLNPLMDREKFSNKSKQKWNRVISLMLGIT